MFPAGSAGGGSGSNALIPILTMASAGIAAFSVVALTALQSDSVSRRILSPDRLEDKRHAEFVYRWTQALEKAKLQLQFCGAGGTTDYKFAEEEELVNTTFLTTVDELQPFVKKLVDRKANCDNDNDNWPVRIGRIGTDKRMKKPSELYIWLYKGRFTIYQAPLRLFGILVAGEMDKKIANATFCFVADASAGVASQLIVDLVQQATKGHGAVCVLPEPLWMVQFAVIAEQRLFGSAILERILFALCRLEALHLATSKKESTILVTLPGQSTTSILLPLVQKAFPDDRHVFAYTSCVQTVEYATLRRKSYPRAQVPKSMEEALRFTNPVCHTTPLSRSLSQSTRVNQAFLSTLRNLPLGHADIVESWMGTVDTFFRLKDEEKTNGYLPYVFKLDYLLNDGPLTANASDRYWALISLLQFVLGSRSREIPSEQIDAAISWLQDYQNPMTQGPKTSTSSPSSFLVSKEQAKAIQNVVFQHKLILIENKTLMDTVQPVQHWKLKATVKAGCACCAPEEDDEEEVDNAKATSTPTEAAASSAISAPMQSNYVDGKSTFAFDPSRFTSSSSGGDASGNPFS
ncbi:hypothetical protein ACA910_019350 [Epithemia clementina (nom. ined.)]